MLKFVKYIIFIFGGLASCILGFFGLQNKHDLMAAMEYRGQLNYEGLVKSCLNVEKKYYYPCFKERFDKYLDMVSLTGTSIGLKIAFNMMDEDKEKTTYFSDDTVKELQYSINYLELNNMAIDNSYQRFHGFDFMYGGFIISLGDYIKKATDFSDNLIKGLKGKEGIDKVSNSKEKEELKQRLSVAIEEYQKVSKDLQNFIDKETKRLDAELAEKTK